MGICHIIMPLVEYTCQNTAVLPQKHETAHFLTSYTKACMLMTGVEYMSIVQYLFLQKHTSQQSLKRPCPHEPIDMHVQRHIKRKSNCTAAELPVRSDQVTIHLPCACMGIDIMQVHTIL
jgi:hypothetical protein